MYSHFIRCSCSPEIEEKIGVMFVLANSSLFQIPLLFKMEDTSPWSVLTALTLEFTSVLCLEAPRPGISHCLLSTSQLSSPCIPSCTSHLVIHPLLVVRSPLLQFLQCPGTEWGHPWALPSSGHIRISPSSSKIIKMGGWYRVWFLIMLHKMTLENTLAMLLIT